MVIHPGEIVEFRKNGVLKGTIEGSVLRSTDPDRKWYVRDMGTTYGPLTITELEDMIRTDRVTPLARYKEIAWEKWNPIIGHYFAEAQKDMERTAESLPREIRKYAYLALFYVGVVIFIAGLVFFGTNFLLGPVLFVLGYSIEIVSMYRDGKYTKKFIKGLGNVFVYFMFLASEFVVILLLWRILYS